MRIIKQGEHPSKRFYCRKCGCEFEADETEYRAASWVAQIHDGIVAECNCPCCENVVYSYDDVKL